jgi:hypothetical protein
MKNYISRLFHYAVQNPDQRMAPWTKNQPSAYLDKVDNKGIVLFVAPAWRLQSL